ncbi:hypothetical protein B4O97_18960 [Marispirochaeta aestuarii]|uniref:Lipoprotein n=1 Tax=Marispirochaeta aestuarii TaxID=1963862 RepID=A0A1Y1RSS2_9SPIO|nr:hypothetical protein [Marispirochaeta aestuarii]ORC28821.1 hypothetical protein B4O97_18960 [Marispirochaeta aestuarii]
MFQRLLAISSFLLFCVIFIGCSVEYNIIWRGYTSEPQEIELAFSNNGNASKAIFSMIVGSTKSINLAEDSVLRRITNDSNISVFIYPKIEEAIEQSLEIFILPNYLQSSEDQTYKVRALSDAVAYSVTYEKDGKIYHTISKDNSLHVGPEKDIDKISKIISQLNNEDYTFFDEWATKVHEATTPLNGPKNGYVFLSEIDNKVLWFTSSD